MEMRYVGTYDVNRRIHLRPYHEVAAMASALTAERPDMRVLVRNAAGDVGREPVECWDVQAMAESHIGQVQGLEVEVIAKGPYELKTLQECAGKVGEIFSCEDGTARDHFVLAALRR